MRISLLDELYAERIEGEYMKKAFILLLLAALLLFAGCSSNQQPNETGSHDSPDNGEYFVTQALDLLLRWEESDYSDITSRNSFCDLYMEAQDKLGVEHQVVRIFDYAYTFGMSYENETIIDMVIDILSFGDESLPVTFIDETTYLFNDVRYEYDPVYPVYDLETGLYGLYNLSTRQYIYEPTLTYLSAPDDLGYICLCYQDYYGCIDMQGEKVIGFIYEEPFYFQENLAVVKTNQKYGVINISGTDVLSPKYGDIEIFDHVIAANKREDKLGESDFSEVALFTHNGAQLTNHDYCDIEVLDDRIYAKYREDDDVKLDLQLDEIWFDLYDLYGNRLIGEGTSVPEAWGVKMPSSNGIMLAICDEEVTNEYGFSYPRYHLAGFNEYGYRYITNDLQWLNRNTYETYLRAFNSNGYAVASVYDKSSRDEVRVILDSNGNQIDSFRLDDCEWYMPIDTNGYVYKMSHHSKENDFAVCVRATRDLVPYASVQMIYGTDLVIVEDEDTGLYGLYDQDILALDLIYTEIYYTSNYIVATRGAEETTYTPICERVT